MTHQEANEKIAALLKHAEEAISQAESIADEAGVDFYWDGPTYGMGGTYYPAKVVEEQGYRYIEEGWNSSSGSC